MNSTKKIATGGPLNYLNEQMHCNAIRKTVSVMQLVQGHRPNSSEELQKLIADHMQGTCSVCGQRSAGTVEQFGNGLYESQFKCKGFSEAYGEFTQEQCFQFMFNLFCITPIRGIIMEQKSRESILQLVNDEDYSFRIATEQEDRFNAIDYFVTKKSLQGYVDILGVQVKPSSFWRYSDSVKANDLKHGDYISNKGIKVVYHVYDSYSLEFRDSKGAAQLIRSLEMPPHTSIHTPIHPSIPV